MAQTSGFYAGPGPLPSGVHPPWKRIIILGLLVLVPVGFWLAGGFSQRRTRKTPEPQAMLVRPAGKSILDELPKSYRGVAQDGDYAPSPPVVQQVPVDTSAKDEQIDGLTRLLQDANARIKALEEARKAPPAPQARAEDPEARERREAAKRRAEERRKEDDHARETLVVWQAKKEDREKDVQQLSTPYSLPPSTLIPCVTEMQVTNQAPGAFRAFITQPVRSPRGEVVIPQGSVLVMEPSGKTIFGDTRLSVQASTLTFPDGRFLKFPKATVGDETGAAGFSDQIDRRWGSLFASILLTGVLRSGTTLAGGYGGDPLERVGGAVAGETAQQGTQQVRQALRTEPILTIRPAYRCELLLQSELVLTRAYED